MVRIRYLNFAGCVKILVFLLFYMRVYTVHSVKYLELAVVSGLDDLCAGKDGVPVVPVRTVHLVVAALQVRQRAFRHRNRFA